MNYIHYITSDDIWNILLVITTIVTSASAIMLPLLLNAINRIDEKYLASLDIVQTFKNSSQYKLFYYSAISSFVLLGISILLKVTTECCCINVLSIIITACCVIVLLIGMFKSISLIYSFYIPSKLFNYLKKQYEKASDVMYFNAIKKVLHYVIRSGDAVLREDIMEFFCSCYKNDKESKWEKRYYNFANETLEFSFSEDGAGTRLFDNHTLMYFFLKDKMHDDDYAMLWNNLVKAVCRRKEKFVLDYFKNANFHLDKLKDDERNRFIKFHYIVCAMILYSGNYFLLKRIIMTPEYNSIIPIYFEIKMLEMPITKDEAFKYSFPDITENFEVKSEYLECDWSVTPIIWTKKLIALLYIRYCNVNGWQIQDNMLYDKLEANAKKDIDNYCRDKTIPQALGLIC